MFRLNRLRFFQLETKSDERGNEGLYNTFMENFPITDTRNNVEFLDYFVDPPRYTIQECIERGLTYSAFKSKVKTILYRSRARRF
jgi:DNA-directed RNA polymerase subunit beta